VIDLVYRGDAQHHIDNITMAVLLVDVVDTGSDGQAHVRR